MSSSLAAQAAALQTTLDAITDASCTTGDYGIMISATKYALVLWPGSGDMHDIGMGGVWGYDDVIYADAFIHTEGDAEVSGLACFTLVDEVKDAIDGDETLGATCQAIKVEYDYQGQVEISEAAWHWIIFRFPIEQF
jgi:hypothetical protein